jgi:hypothetical protein
MGGQDRPNSASIRAGAARATRRVGATADLSTWVTHDWSDSVGIDSLKTFDRLTVETRNTIYEIIVVTPRDGEVLVKGGAFFPDFTCARVVGSSLGGSFLKSHSIVTGFRMELGSRRRVVTTPVTHVALKRGRGPASPHQSPSKSSHH